MSMFYVIDEARWVNGQILAVDNLKFTNSFDLIHEFARDPIKREFKN